VSDACARALKVWRRPADPCEEALVELSGATLPELTAPERLPASRRDAEAARQFEGYLLGMLLREMRKTVQPGGLFSTRATEGYLSLAFDALAERAASANTFGLAQKLLDQWERHG
jgi:Rod binding domain-containing protein